MKIALKIVILSLIIALPMMIFLFLKGFGESQFELPVFYKDTEDINNFRIYKIYSFAY